MLEKYYINEMPLNRYIFQIFYFLQKCDIAGNIANINIVNIAGVLFQYQ